MASKIIALFQSLIKSTRSSFLRKGRTYQIHNIRSVINKNAESTYNLRNPLTFADSAYKFCGFHLHLRIPLKFCGIHLQLRNPEQLAIFACCGIRNKTNVPTKFTLQAYGCGIHWNFVCGIHLHFGTYFKTCLWNPGTYRHKTVLLSSAQFGVVMSKRADASFHPGVGRTPQRVPPFTILRKNIHSKSLRFWCKILDCFWFFFRQTRLFHSSDLHRILHWDPIRLMWLHHPHIQQATTHTPH